MDFNDDFSEMLDGGESLDYTSYYQKMEIEQAEATIKQKCRKFLRSMASVYGGITELPNSDEIHIKLDKHKQAFLEQAEIESVPLEAMLFQVSVGKHVLKTLMGHLNNGGAIDEGLFDRIFKAQTSLMSVTNTLAKYIRTLPSFFNQLSEELRINDQQIIEGEIDDAYEVMDSEVKQLPQSSDNPFMGHKDFLESIREQQEMLSKEFNDADGVDVTRDGNIGNNPLRGDDGKMDLENLI